MKFIFASAIGIFGLGFFLGACGDDSPRLSPCERNTDDCVAGATCNPTTGAETFSCSCPSGFTGDGETFGTGCANIDECAAGTDDCFDGAAALCTDSEGSFSCSCVAGYTGDGTASGGCTDTDECSAAAAPCDSAAVCSNLEGSFECRGLYAPSPFRNRVYRLDPVTLSTLETLVPTIAEGPISGAVSFSEDPTDRRLYAVVKLATGRTLAHFDPSAKTYTAIAPLAHRFASIAFDSAGQLFGVTGNGSGPMPETLYSLDKATGEATLLRFLGAGADGEVIAFNPEDGLLYHWSGGTSFFEAITMTDPYEISPRSSTFNREVFGALWDPIAKNFITLDIASAARRFFVDGTFTTTNEATFPDDLRSPGFAPALPHTVSAASGDLAGGLPLTLTGNGLLALGAVGATVPVSFGGTPSPATIVDDHTLTVTTPAVPAPGPVDLFISAGDLQFRWRASFTYTGTVPPAP